MLITIATNITERKRHFVIEAFAKVDILHTSNHQHLIARREGGRTRFIAK